MKDVRPLGTKLGTWVSHLRQARRPAFIAWWTAFLLPFVLYAYFAVRYAQNIPYYDDFNAVLGFLGFFVQAETLGEKLTLLFRQHNEHRIVFERILFLIQHYVLGGTNFKHLFIVGKVGCILTALFLVYVGKRRLNLPRVYLLPIPYFLLAMAHWQNDAMGLIYNYWFIFFSIVHLYFLAEKKVKYACLLFPLTLFTGGGGVLFYALGNLFWFLQKRWKDLTIYFAVSTLFTIVYFYDYHSTGQPGISNQLINLEQTITYFFVFLGNILFQSETTAFPIGVTTVVLLIAFSLRGTKENNFLYLMTAFILLIAATVALSRSHIGINQALRERYTMYPLLAWICIYLWMTVTVKNRTLVKKIVCVSLTVGVLLFFGMLLMYELGGHFEKQKVERLSGLALLAQGDASNLAFVHPRPNGATQYLLKAKRQNIYDRGNAPYIVPEELDANSITSNSPFRGVVGQFEVSSDSTFLGRVKPFEGWYIRGWALIPELNATDSEIFILLTRGDKTFKLKTFSSNKRRDVTRHFNARRRLYDDSGYIAFIAAYAIPPGTYTVSILVEQGDQKALHREKRKAVVP